MRVIAILLLSFSSIAHASEIHDAIQKKDLNAVKALVTANPQLVNEKDDAIPFSPLQHAAMIGSKDIAEFLIAKGTAIQTKDEPVSLLAMAAAGGSKELVELLLSKGADVAWKDEGGMTPLCYAKTGEIAALLIEKGAKLEAAVKGCKSPLHWAAINGSVDVVKVLLAKGADIKGTDQIGCTALHDATMSGSKDVVALLLDNGADPNAMLVTGRTPLDMALIETSSPLKMGDPKAVAKLLREKGGKTAKELGPALTAADAGGDKVLAEKLSDKDAKVRLEAVKSLSAAEAELSVSALVVCLRDADEQVRFASAEHLKKLGAKAIPVLAQALKPPPTNDHIGVLGRPPSKPEEELPKDVPGLVALLKDPDKRPGAIRALGKLGPQAKDAVPALTALIPEVRWGGLCATLRALGEIGPDSKAAVPTIIPLLGYEKTVDQSDKKLKVNARFVAKYAAYALVAIDPSRDEALDAARIIVVDLTHDDLVLEKSSHAVAIEALTKIGERVVPVMIETLQKRATSGRE